MKIEAENLIPYLPYSLKVLMEGKKTNVAWMSTKKIAVIIPEGMGECKKISWKHAHLNIKPFLKPLSGIDWKVFIDENHRKMSDVIHDFIQAFEDDVANQHTLFESAPLIIANYAFKNKYDVFGLIEKELAIDLTLNK